MKELGPFHVIQFDAHLDFVDESFGVREGHGNPMRRISEMKHVSGITQIGIRGPGSSSRHDFDDARALAPGNGSPSPGGLDYYEVADVLRGIADRGEVVGFDFCEVAPMYDPTGVTCQVAARIILDFVGAIFYNRKIKQRNP